MPFLGLSWNLPTTKKNGLRMTKAKTDLEIMIPKRFGVNDEQSKSDNSPLDSAIAEEEKQVINIFASQSPPDNYFGTPIMHRNGSFGIDLFNLPNNTAPNGFNS